MSYADTYTQTPAEMLAGEFVVTYTKSGSWVHPKECARYRTQIRSEACVGALRHGAVLAICCRDHELRYLKPRQAGRCVVSAELKRAADDFAAARARLYVARQEAKRVALAELAAGTTEVDVAAALGVNRLTVRDWQGKSRKALLAELPGREA